LPFVTIKSLSIGLGWKRNGILELKGGFVADDAIFVMLLRYETSIERSLFRARHELQDLQAARIDAFGSEPMGADLKADRPLSEDFSMVTDEMAGNEARINNNLAQDREN
jgi:hypothetical protein